MTKDVGAYPAEQNTPANPAVELVKQYWLPIILTVVAVVFIAQNRNRFNFNFLWIDWSMPQWLALTVVVLIGVAVGWFLGVRRYKRKAGA
ncbi:DUF1049 domain-containing protein [Gordonia pseudamarae]|jgi:uncharacterized integral membrane protein|uniref:DUF1049 domain-containing protein n=1 Tax=Gordonia pseudamarae TaxID=2831662 RepID=A0ABX6IHX8_9ACTN|nr:MULTISPECIES: LapA family protein [Gordonia]MBD0023762.1 LapA family protein [Gordonia sp. (in: high G+C Gram-positive bacteria)]QHN26546.1 DUF1049 domain-containing protein [Gordonia pseudamarae]QHN35439.1 DUF1049 domain-containing protein [Gordonia pseudamarae]